MPQALACESRESISDSQVDDSVRPIVRGTGMTAGISRRIRAIACVAVLSGCAAKPDSEYVRLIEYVQFTIPPQLSATPKVSEISESDFLGTPGAEDAVFFYLQGSVADDGRIRLYAERSMFNLDELVGPATKFAALETFFRERKSGVFRERRSAVGDAVTISEQKSFELDSIPGYQFVLRTESPGRRPKLRVVRALYVESQLVVISAETSDAAISSSDLAEVIDSMHVQWGFAEEW